MFQVQTSLPIFKLSKPRRWRICRLWIAKAALTTKCRSCKPVRTMRNISTNVQRLGKIVRSTRKQSRLKRKSGTVNWRKVRLTNSCVAYSVPNHKTDEVFVKDNHSTFETLGILHSFFRSFNTMVPLSGLVGYPALARDSCP